MAELATIARPSRCAVHAGGLRPDHAALAGWAGGCGGKSSCFQFVDSPKAYQVSPI
jgi:hypothetical protein